MTRDREQWEEHIRRQSDPTAPLPRKTHRATSQDLEFKIQSGFIDWVRMVEMGQIPELRLLYAIPSGGNRHPAVGAKMKREGVVRGVPDLHLPIGRGGYLSLYLETKTPDPNSKLSKWQIERIAWLEAEGNLVRVCHAIDELIDAVVQYLALEPTRRSG